MGVIPRALRNIYMIGYTRPYTGGLANIIEMQGLLVHKLVTQPDFHRRIHHNLSDRIAAYDEHYFGNRKPHRYDHLVYYGFYTEDIARLIGIDHKLSDCTSLKDLMFYYAFPNNAFKYRLKGEYAVDGVAGLIEKVNGMFDNFVVIFAYLLASGTKDAGTCAEWLQQARRNLFNDMRHKEPYRLFLEYYIQTYRRLKKVSIENVEDPQWEALVAKACASRDQAVQMIQKPARFQLDEDVAHEARLISTWMKSGHALADIHALKLDPGRAAFLSSLINPAEYDLPYLQ